MMKLYIGNLSHSASESELKTLLKKIGNVVSVKIITDRYTQESRGFGFVEMESRDDGKKAIEELDGQEFQGRRLVVNEARPKEAR